MHILNYRQIQQKIVRLAYEIIEQNAMESKIYLAGINNNGYAFAKLLLHELDNIERDQPAFELFRLNLDPASPVSSDIRADYDLSLLENQVVIIVDDVANTGRTLFYSFQAFENLLVKKMQVAVLVDRKHKNFPIQVDFVGMSLATTLEDHINVDLRIKENWYAAIV